MRSSLLLVILLVSSSCTVADARQAADRALSERADELMKTTPLIDGHNDLPWAMREGSWYDFDAVDIRRPQPQLMTDIDRLRAGRVGGQFWSVYVPASLQGQAAVTATLEQIDAVYELVRRYPDTFAFARTAADVERVFREGKIASLMGVEGGHSIDGSMGTLRMFHQLGVGYMTLTHSANLPWADAATGEPEHDGLTPFGEDVVREMNRLGMLVDLSHVAPATMRDALRVSRAPVIFSHSSARALCDVPRNVPDDVLRQVTTNGGVVMVTFVPGFISQEVADDSRAAQAERRRLQELPGSTPATVDAGMMAWRRTHPQPRATLAQVADHIDHIRKVAGEDHVGLGGDFDGITAVVQGLEDVATYPALIVELLRRGWTDEAVRKLLGENVLRVMRQAEAVASQLQGEGQRPSRARLGSGLAAR